jgi:hypothetical protein
VCFSDRPFLCRELVNRRKAEEWCTYRSLFRGGRWTQRAPVSHQVVVMDHLMEGLPRVTGHSGGSMVYRPFFVLWFMGQICRALTLWSMDNSLLVALEVGKAVMVPMEHLMLLFPCDGALSVVSATSRMLTSVVKLNALFMNVSASNWWLLA